MDERTKKRAYWRCQIIGWAGYSGVGLIFIALFPPGPPFWKWIVVYAAAAALALACSHAYRGFVRRHGWQRLSPLRLLPRVTMASIVVGTVITVLVSGVYWLAFPPAFLHSDGLDWLFPAVYTWMAAVFVWSLIYFGQHYFEQVHQAQFAALRLEVAQGCAVAQPHRPVEPALPL